MPSQAGRNFEVYRGTIVQRILAKRSFNGPLMDPARPETRFEVDEHMARVMIPKTTGIPFVVNHDMDKQIGRVLASYRCPEKNTWDIAFGIRSDTPLGQESIVKLEGNLWRGLSLSHDAFTLEPREASLCLIGARPGTHVHGKQVDPAESKVEASLDRAARGVPGSTPATSHSAANEEEEEEEKDAPTRLLLDFVPHSIQRVADDTTSSSLVMASADEAQRLFSRLAAGGGGGSPPPAGGGLADHNRQLAHDALHGDDSKEQDSEESEEARKKRKAREEAEAQARKKREAEAAAAAAGGDRDAGEEKKESQLAPAAGAGAQQQQTGALDARDEDEEDEEDEAEEMDVDRITEAVSDAHTSATALIDSAPLSDQLKADLKEKASVPTAKFIQLLQTSKRNKEALVDQLSESEREKAQLKAALEAAQREKEELQKRAAENVLHAQREVLKDAQVLQQSGALAEREALVRVAASLTPEQRQIMSEELGLTRSSQPPPQAAPAAAAAKTKAPRLTIDARVARQLEKLTQTRKGKDRRSVNASLLEAMAYQPTPAQRAAQAEAQAAAERAALVQASYDRAGQHPMSETTGLTLRQFVEMTMDGQPIPFYVNASGITPEVLAEATKAVKDLREGRVNASALAGMTRVLPGARHPDGNPEPGAGSNFPMDEIDANMRAETALAFNASVHAHNGVIHASKLQSATLPVWYGTMLYGSRNNAEAEERAEIATREAFDRTPRNKWPSIDKRDPMYQKAGSSTKLMDPYGMRS